MVARQASVCRCHGAAMVKGTVKMEQMRSSVLQVSPGRERERKRNLLKIAPVWIMHSQTSAQHVCELNGVECR